MMVISIVYSKNDDSSHVTKSTRSPIGNNSQEAKKNQNDSYSELPDENDIAPETEISLPSGNWAERTFRNTLFPDPE